MLEPFFSALMVRVSRKVLVRSGYVTPNKSNGLFLKNLNLLMDCGLYVTDFHDSLDKFIIKTNGQKCTIITEECNNE